MTSPTTSVFNPNVPKNASDSLATTQPQFLDNFLSLYRQFAANHLPLDVGSSAGNHTVIQLREQPKDLQTDITEINVFTKKVENETDQIFVQFPGPAPAIQLSNYQLYSIGPITGNETTQQAFFTTLPGGIIVYFGSFRPLNQNKVFLFPPICKNVISFSATSAEQASPISPYVYLYPPQNGYFREALIVVTPLGVSSSPNCFYMVIGNT